MFFIHTMNLHDHWIDWNLVCAKWNRSNKVYQRLQKIDFHGSMRDNKSSLKCVIKDLVAKHIWYQTRLLNQKWHYFLLTSLRMFAVVLTESQNICTLLIKSNEKMMRQLHGIVLIRKQTFFYFNPYHATCFKMFFTPPQILPCKLAGFKFLACIYSQHGKQCGSWSAGFWEASWSESTQLFLKK